MIVTVTPNPALDLTYPVRPFELGESQRVPTAVARAGGKGLNVARVLHQTGHPVLAIAAVGGAPGDEFAAELAASGVPHQLVRVAGTTRRTIAIVEQGTEPSGNHPGRTSNFNEYGLNHTPAEWQHLTDAVIQALDQARCLVGSGSLPEGADPGFYADLVSLARAAGVPSVVDTSGAALLAAAAAGATVVKPNQRELAEATGDGDPVQAARGLVSAGAGLVLVSLGAAGMLAVSAADRDRVWRARLPRVLAGNPTGAGDAAVAAVAAVLAGRTGSLDTGADTGEILRLATAWSAAAVQMPLAGEIAAGYEALASELVVDRVPDRAWGGTSQ
jgi:1-phosphofructokinase family hexose kinase